MRMRAMLTKTDTLGIVTRSAGLGGSFLTCAVTYGPNYNGTAQRQQTLRNENRSIQDFFTQPGGKKTVKSLLRRRLKKSVRIYQ